MTPEQGQLVRLSFVQVMDRKQDVGRIFYDRLFAIAPDLRPLFKNDIDQQAQKLMDMLALAIGHLKNPTGLSVMLEGLGRRHVGYGVQDQHYAIVGEALIWSLQKALGADFTPPLRDAWIALYTVAADTMKSADTPQAARA
ncbi:MAG: hemin receptor [Pseudolabrys sp.]|nr:hemin receptor [Pseudolabrys sp.]